LLQRAFLNVGPRPPIVASARRLGTVGGRGIVLGGGPRQGVFCLARITAAAQEGGAGPTE
jgi:hypothetical protein